MGLLRKLDVSIWDWLNKIYENSTLKKFEKFNNLLNDFLDDSENELWEDLGELRKFTNNKENIQKFINGNLGSNLIFKYKSRSLTKDLENIGQIAEISTVEILKEKKIELDGIEEFIKELVSFKKCQVEDIFALAETKINSFNYDIPIFLKDIQFKDKNLKLSKYRFSYSRKFEFKLNIDHEQIKSYNSLFGTKIDGISRTLSRVYIKKLFRNYNKDKIEDIAEFSEKQFKKMGWWFRKYINLEIN